VLQGERSISQDNRTLGKFNLEGLPLAPRGVPQIEVTFDIDANGIVSVSARDRATGKEQKITITASSGLEPGEVEKLVRQASEHEADDRRRKEEVELRNRLDTLVYQLDRQLAEMGDRLDRSHREAVDSALRGARTALESGSADDLRRAEDALNRAAHEMARAVYGAVGNGPAAGPSCATGRCGPSDDTIDADFEEVKRAS